MTLAVDRKGFPPGKLNSPARAPDMAAASSKRHFREPPPLTLISPFPLIEKSGACYTSNWIFCEQEQREVLARQISC